MVFVDEEEHVQSVNLSVQSPVRHLFRYESSNRSRRNVVDHFPRLRSKVLTNISIAEGDRLITWTFEEGHVLVMIPFGARANALHLDGEGAIVASFKSNAPENAPEPLSASMPASVDEVERLLTSGKPASKLWPLLSGPLRDELLFRVGGTEDPARLFETGQNLLRELDQPTPRLYKDEDGEPTLALAELRHLGTEAERFDSVDKAVRVCARIKLAQTRFDGEYKPLLGAIRKRFAQAERSLQRVESELAKPSRAEHYEHLGHLLMAQLHQVKAGAEVAQLPDLLGDGSTVTIRLDSTLSAVENAQRYYEKAKSSRAAREVAQERLEGLRSQASRLEILHSEVKELADVAAVRDFKQRNADVISTLQQAAGDEDGIPYRRIDLGEGYEIWVGRNARQNDELTLRDSRPFDLWMHARGVAGSHAVLRVKGRTDKPPRHVVEKAAAVAAWFSKARTSALAPVIVTQRKYVRKPRKAAQGAVRIEREEVILIEPGLPN